MGNCQLTEIWTPRIDKPYVVRLERQYTWCGEVRELFINDIKREDFALSRTNNCSWSPLCGPDESFAWEEHGRQFLLQFNVLTCCSEKYFRLFVDGVDEGTGLGFSAYFRRQGHIRLVAALIFFFLLGGGIALVLLIPNGLGQLWLPINLGMWFFIFLITGLIAVIKFKTNSPMETKRTAPSSWPEAYRSTTFGTANLA